MQGSNKRETEPVGAEKRQTLAYLSSPYNDEKLSVRLHRHRAAKDAAARLMLAGQRVFSPIAHNVALIESAGIETGWEIWGEFDKDMLSRCDELIVLMLPGWEKSKGVTEEIREAERLGLPISFLDPGDLPTSSLPKPYATQRCRS